MDASVGCNDASPSPPLPAESAQSPADQARERLLTISQADTGSGLQDLAKVVVGEKGVEKYEEGQSPVFSPHKEKAKQEEEADQDEVFRKKLISISYDGASESIPLPNGAQGASPPPAVGNGQPPA